MPTDPLPTTHRADPAEAGPAAERVSVVIAAYNATGLLARAIESVAAQTWPDVELIVVDDGSDDDTAALAEALIAERTRPGFCGRVLRQANLGAAAARNYGVAVATGEWVGLLDHDDLYHRRRVESLMTVAAAHGCPAVATTAVKFCAPQDRAACERQGEWVDTAVDADEELARLVHGPDPQVGPSPAVRLDAASLLWGNRILSMSVLVRRELLIRAGLFPPNLLGAEDYACWINLSRLEPILFVDLPGYFHRVRMSSVSRTTDMLMFTLVALVSQWYGGRHDPRGTEAPLLGAAGRGYRDWAFEHLVVAAARAGDRWRLRAALSLAHFLVPDPADRRLLRRRAARQWAKHRLSWLTRH